MSFLLGTPGRSHDSFGECIVVLQSILWHNITQKERWFSPNQRIWWTNIMKFKKWKCEFPIQNEWFSSHVSSPEKTHGSPRWMIFKCANLTPVKSASTHQAIRQEGGLLVGIPTQPMNMNLYMSIFFKLGSCVEWVGRWETYIYI